MALPMKYWFDCDCSLCKKFWKETFGKNVDILRKPPELRTSLTSSMLQLPDGLVKIGDRVRVWGAYTGVVKYIGPIDDKSVAPKIFVGVKLDDNVGAMTNGMYNGKRYFSCPTGHGVLVKCADIQPIPLPDVHPSVSGNKMFPSYKEITKRRKKLAEKDPERDPARFVKGGKETKATFRLMQRLAKGQKVDVDENDVVYKDAKKLLESYLKQKAQSLENLNAEDFRQHRLKYWMQAFGNDERAKQMVSTLSTLYNAYDDGVHLIEEQKRMAKLEAEAAAALRAKEAAEKETTDHGF